MTSIQWDIIISYCDRHDIWLIVDMAFCGLSWSNENVWIDRGRLMRANYKKSILLDSPAKRLFSNNLKIAVVLADESVVRELIQFTDSYLGNLTGIQMAFAQSLFESHNRNQLEDICRINAQRARDNFYFIERIVNGSEKVFLQEPDAGFHALLFQRTSSSEKIEIMTTCQAWMTKHNLLAVPTHDFRFDQRDEFGIRINLTRSPEELVPLIRLFSKSGLLI